MYSILTAFNMICVIYNCFALINVHTLNIKNMNNNVLEFQTKTKKFSN